MYSVDFFRSGCGAVNANCNDLCRMCGEENAHIVGLTLVSPGGD